jgi:hypothetical protein
VVYLPILLGNLSDIGNGLNYFMDTLLLAGSVLALAQAEDRKSVLATSAES